MDGPTAWQLDEHWSYTNTRFSMSVNYTDTLTWFFISEEVKLTILALEHNSFSLIQLTRWARWVPVDREYDVTIFSKVAVRGKQLHHLVPCVCRLDDNTAVITTLSEDGALVIDVIQDDVHLHEEKRNELCTRMKTEERTALLKPYKNAMQACHTRTKWHRQTG